jgi:hypothetical protein
VLKPAHFPLPALDLLFDFRVGAVPAECLVDLALQLGLAYLGLLSLLAQSIQAARNLFGTLIRSAVIKLGARGGEPREAFHEVLVLSLQLLGRAVAQKRVAPPRRILLCGEGGLVFLTAIAGLKELSDGGLKVLLSGRCRIAQKSLELAINGFKVGGGATLVGF